MIIVSESNERHCAGTVESHGVGIWYVKQMCLETGLQDSHRRCGSDMFKQTVPDTSSGDRKSSVADGRQSEKLEASKQQWKNSVPIRGVCVPVSHWQTELCH